MRGKELFAYLAGIIDGEGYVGIKRSTWGMRNRTDVKNPIYSERVGIKMSTKEPLDLFKANFGGSLCRDKKIYQSKTGFKTNKVMYVYLATDRIAVKILEATLPYLIIKKRQAKLTLKLRKSKNDPEARRIGSPARRVMMPHIVRYREFLYNQIKIIHTS